MAIVADFESYPQWNNEVKAVYVLARYDDGRPSHSTAPGSPSAPAWLSNQSSAGERHSLEGDNIAARVLENRARS